MTLRRSLPAIGFLVLVATRAFAADPVGTWDISGQVRVTVCAQGRCQSRHAAGEGVVSIAADGTYVAPTEFGGCDVPDEEGTWVAARRGRYVLRPTNAADLVSAINDCLGVEGLTLRGRFRLVFKPNADGTTATAKGVFRGHGSYHGVAFTASAVGHYQGTRSEDVALRAALPISGAGGSAGILGLVQTMQR